MASLAKERVTFSLTPEVVSFLDRFKKKRRVSRSRALELLIEERQREEKRKSFLEEAREFFANENLADQKESAAMEHAALADWAARED